MRKTQTNKQKELIKRRLFEQICQKESVGKKFN